MLHRDIADKGYSGKGAGLKIGRTNNPSVPPTGSMGTWNRFPLRKLPFTMGQHL